MAMMISTRTLRSSPGGDGTINAGAGMHVKVLDATKPPWMKIQLLDGKGDPTGWVSAAAVNPADDATVPPLDKLVFANECCRQALVYGISAHYLAAVAETRTGIKDEPSGNGVDKGPFALSPTEWPFACALPDSPDLQLGFAPEDINKWRFQCQAFAVLTLRAQQKLTDALKDQPDSTQLYLAQLIGTSAAAAAIGKTDQQISAVLLSTPAEDFKSDGIDPAGVLTRYAALLQNVDVATAMQRITDALQKALDSTRSLIQQAGGEVIGKSATELPTLSASDINISNTPTLPAAANPTMVAAVPAATNSNAAAAPAAANSNTMAAPAAVTANATVLPAAATASATVVPAVPHASGGAKIDRQRFYANFPSTKLNNKQVNPSRKAGFEAIFDVWDAVEHFDFLEWLAYALATAWHETGSLMQPVREGFAKTDAQAFARVSAYCQRVGRDNYARRASNGMSYYGRGYVQLTFADNYLKMGKRLGLGTQLVNNPDLVMNPQIAANILLTGMVEGLFRPKAGRLADYFNNQEDDWTNARGLINGDISKNGPMIGGYGKAFFSALAYQ